MKKKLVFLSFILSLLAFCLGYGEGADAARNQEIQSEVIEPSPLPILSDNISNYESVISSNQTIEMKNPTFEELRNFILKDTTSRKQFVLNQYECRHFATEVDNNAEAAGLRCGFALICYERGCCQSAIMRHFRTEHFQYSQ